MRKRSLRSRRGNSLVEFALVMAYLVPLLAAIWTFGIGLNSSIQTLQMTHVAATLLVRGINLGSGVNPSNQDLILKASSGLNIQKTSGDGVIVLSNVLRAGPISCGGYNPCPNLNTYVYVSQVAIGNRGLSAKPVVGYAPTELMDTTNNNTILPRTYLTNPAYQATGFPQIIDIIPDTQVYVVESIVDISKFAIFGPIIYGQQNYNGLQIIYQRTVT